MLRRGGTLRVWFSADGVTWHEVPNTPWGDPPRRERIRIPGRPVDGRREQHDARLLEAHPPEVGKRALSRSSINNYNTGSGQNQTKEWHGPVARGDA
jgi:hypothetical protein